MKLSITKKIIGLVGLSIVLMMFFSITAAYKIVTKQMNEAELAHIFSLQKVVDSKFEDTKNKYLSIVTTQVTSDNIINAVSGEDSEVLKQIGRSLIETKNAEFVVFTDVTGKVISRGHSDKKDDNISNQFAFKQSLKGISSVGLEEGTIVRLSLRASAPIIKDEKIIGVMIIGMNIFEGNSFVDSIKNILDIDCTIFDEDARVSTTIIKEDGNRAIGTKMDNPIVIETVLKNEKIFNSINTILGFKYSTVYWPLKNIEGKTLGMLFIGKKRIHIEYSQRLIVLSISSWIFIIGLLSLIFSFLLTNRGIVVPLKKATIFAKLATDEKTTRNLTIKNKDEIGDLAHSLNQMVENLAKTKKEAFFQASEIINSVVEGLTITSGILEEKLRNALEGSLDQKSRIRGINEAISIFDITINDLANVASNSASNSEQMIKKAKTGVNTVEKAVISMSDVNFKVEEMNRDLISFGELSGSIENSLDIIENISNRTHILAINAKIESARAGKAGQAFNIVADEIRELANRSKISSEGIRRIIEDIQKKIESNVFNMGKTYELVSNTVSNINESGSIIKQILSLAEDVSMQINSVASSTEEQSVTTKEILKDVSEVNSIADNSEILMNDLSKIEMTSLLEKISMLKDLVKEFKNK